MSLNNLNDIFVSLLHTITITLSMKKGILSFLLLAAFLSFNSVSAQNRTCGTDHAVRTALNSHPELQIQMDELEEFTQNYSMSTERVTRVIPIVFHVIHNYGQENISKEQILDAVRIINEDFQLQNEDQSSVRVGQKLFNRWVAPVISNTPAPSSQSYSEYYKSLSKQS